MFLQPMKKEDIPPMTLMSMWNQVRNAATQGVQGGFSKVGETIQKTPLLKLGVNVLNAADYGLGTIAKTTEGLLTDRVNTLKNLQYQPGEGLKSYANRNVTDISPYITQKVAGTQFGQKFPMVAPLLGLGAGMLTPSPSDALKVGKFASQAGDVAKFSDDATELVKPKMLDSLASEAKKYKSAEEFVKAQPKLYHGTSKEIIGDIKYPLYLGENLDYAKNYMYSSFSDMPKPKEWYSLKNKPQVLEFVKNPKAEIFDTRNPQHLNLLKDFESNYSQGGVLLSKNKLPEGIEGTDIQEFLEEKGLKFDGMYMDEGDGRGLAFVAFNNNAIIPKSQLTDIWNKAQGK